MVTVGYFSGNVDFDPGVNTHVLTANGNKDGFVSKLTSNGEFISAYGVGGSEDDRINDIDFDAQGNQYIVGFFGSGAAVDFDASPTNVYHLTAQGTKDMFILKMDSTNGFIWAHQFGSNSSTSYISDIGMSILYHNQSIYFTGSFNNTADADPSTSSYMLTSNGSNDGCIIKLNEGCSPTSSSIVESVCETSYESPSGNVYSETGIYSDTITNTSGCDSIITIDLTVGEILNNTITSNGNTLSVTGNLVGTTYEWLNCEDMSTVQSASTLEDLLQPIHLMSYAVIINSHGCIDTTECFTYDKLGLEEGVDQVVPVFPNPLSGNQLMVFNTTHQKMEVIVSNNLGVVLNKYRIMPNQNSIEIPYNKGIYYLGFVVGNKRFTKKIIKVD